jgi:hypothetical protein
VSLSSQKCNFCIQRPGKQSSRNLFPNCFQERLSGAQSHRPSPHRAGLSVHPHLLPPSNLV